jgi:enoyl-CoA hydratase
MSVLGMNVSDTIAVVTLNRPEARNALSPELIVRLARSWQTIRDDADIRAVVLTGAPGSTFCAGFDLAKTIPLFTGVRSPADEWDEALLSDRTVTAKACLRDYDLKKPLIIAANGHAVAGGMELLLAGDLRVVANKAVLGLSEVKLGLIPAMGGTATLIRHMPRALAAEMLLMGNVITADRALAAGFVNRVVEAEVVLATATEIARTIGANAPLAIAAARDLLRTSFDQTEAEALDYETNLAARLVKTEDAVEGPRAFLEKRSPVFKGR